MNSEYWSFIMGNEVVFIFFKFILLLHCTAKEDYMVNALLGENIRVAGQNEFPSAAGIVLSPQIQPVYEAIVCGAVLISSTHVLTCEHCFDDLRNNTVIIIIGSVNIRFGESYLPMWWTSYDQWMQAMNEDLRYPDNDISVLKLLTRVNSRLTPVRISTIPTLDLLFGQEVTTAGWGSTLTDIFPALLHTGNMKVIPNSECEAIFRSIRQYDVYVHRRFFCSKAQPILLLGKGDSGGPLLHQGQLVGLNKATFPRMYGAFHPNRLNYHVNVAYYRHFIRTHLRM